MPKRRPKDTLEEVGKRLLAARESLGLTAAQICRECNIGQTAWANWEAGTNLPDALAMARVRERFGISLDWIYAGDPSGMPYAASSQILNAASQS